MSRARRARQPWALEMEAAGKWFEIARFVSEGEAQARLDSVRSGGSTAALRIRSDVTGEVLVDGKANSAALADEIERVINEVGKGTDMVGWRFVETRLLAERIASLVLLDRPSGTSVEACIKLLDRMLLCSERESAADHAAMNYGATITGDRYAQTAANWSAKAAKAESELREAIRALRDARTCVR